MIMRANGKCKIQGIRKNLDYLSAKWRHVRLKELKLKSRN